MTDRITTLDLVRQANPVPDAEAAAEQLSAHGTLLAAIDRRTAGGLQASSSATMSSTRRTQAALAFGASLVIFLVAVGIAALFVRGTGPDVAVDPVVSSTPAAPSTIAPVPPTPAPAPPTTAAAPSTTVAASTTPTRYEPVVAGMWMRTSGDPAVFGPPEGRDAEVVMMRVAEGGPGFVALGITDLGYGGGQVPTVWLSGDGVYWERLDLPELLGGGPYLGAFDLISTDAGLLASVSPIETGSDAAIWMSVDGRNWFRTSDDTTFGNASIRRIVKLDEGLVALGTRERRTVLWFSADGYDWTTHEPEIDGVVRDLTSTSTGLMAIGNTEPICTGDLCTSTAKMWISRDGLEWSEVIDSNRVFAPSENEQAVWLSRVAATSSGDTVVVTGGAERRPEPDPEPTDCEATPVPPACRGRWVPRMWASADGGATWLLVDPPLEGGALATGDTDHVVLISEYHMAITGNGTDWALLDTTAFDATDYIEDLVVAGDTLVAVGTANGWEAVAWTASWSDLLAAD